VRGDFCWYWWICWPSPNGPTIPPISTKITSHFNSLSDGQQFHQYQQQSPLTSTHWVMVNNSTNITTVIFVDIGGIVDHHSMSWSERWFLLILVELLTITKWIEVRGEWWSTTPPISTKITSHLNSLSDGQQFHQYQQESPPTSTHWVMVNNSTNINKKWEVIFVDIGGIVDHHSMS
jgi:predicted secreted protein